MEQAIKDFELTISKVLRVGIMIVAVFLFVGWILQINLSENVFLQFQDYKEKNFLETLQLAWAENSWGVLVSNLGLIVLVALPVVRVLMTMYLFALQKDFKMMAITLIVLLGLVLSVLLGVVE